MEEFRQGETSDPGRGDGRGLDREGEERRTTVADELPLMRLRGVIHYYAIY